MYNSCKLSSFLPFSSISSSSFFSLLVLALGAPACAPRGWRPLRRMLRRMAAAGGDSPSYYKVKAWNCVRIQPGRLGPRAQPSGLHSSFNHPLPP
jgi:hypothetical protein